MQSRPPYLGDPSTRPQLIQGLGKSAGNAFPHRSWFDRQGMRNGMTPRKKHPSHNMDSCKEIPNGSFPKPGRSFPTYRTRKISVEPIHRWRAHGSRVSLARYDARPLLGDPNIIFPAKLSGSYFRFGRLQYLQAPWL